MPRLPVALPRPEAPRLLLKLNALLLRHLPLIKECPLRAWLRHRVGPQQWLLLRPCLVWAREMKRRLQGPFRQVRPLPAEVLFLGRQHRNPCLVKPQRVHRYLRPHRMRLKEGASRTRLT